MSNVRPLTPAIAMSFAPESEMLNPTGFGWVGLFANDLQNLANFYEKTLGLRVIERGDYGYLFDAGAGALFEIWGQGHASHSRKGPHEQSMLVGFNVSRLEPVVERLKKSGLEPDHELGTHLGARWVYYTDPEGNRFELKDKHG